MTTCPARRLPEWSKRRGPALARSAALGLALTAASAAPRIATLSAGPLSPTYQPVPLGTLPNAGYSYADAIDAQGDATGYTCLPGANGPCNYRHLMTFHDGKTRVFLPEGHGERHGDGGKLRRDGGRLCLGHQRPGPRALRRVSVSRRGRHRRGLVAAAHACRTDSAGRGYRSDR